MPPTVPWQLCEHEEKENQSGSKGGKMTKLLTGNLISSFHATQTFDIKRTIQALGRN